MMFEKPLRVKSYEFEDTTQRLLIRVIQDNETLYNMKKGDVLIARGKDPHIYYSTHGFYVYDLETTKLRGCYHVTNFEILGLFENLESLQKYVFGNTELSGSSKNGEESSCINEMKEKHQQMSIFDF